MLSGVMSIILTFSGRLDLAPLAIFAGAIFDFLDGFLARKMGVSGEMGKQMDSLADIITFGLAPGIIMMNMIVLSIFIEGPYYQMSFTEYAHFQLNNWVNAMFHAVPNSMDASIKYLPFFGLVIPFFSLFRLAKFNVDERQKDIFIGLPTPLNTIFFCFFPLLLWINFERLHDDPGIILSILNPYLLSVLIVVMSLLLVSELPLFSLKFKQLGWRGNEIRYVFLILCSLFIGLFLVWSIPLIVILYLIFSLILQKSNSKEHEIQS